MFRRSLGAALWTLVGLLAGFLGALSSLVGTGAGRALLARVSEGALRQAFTGTMEIGDVRGSLLTGLTLTEVRLFDADTTLVAWLPQANVSYNPFDFAAGRVVLLEFDLRRPMGPSVGLSPAEPQQLLDRKSTRLNSSHLVISYAVFCLKKKKTYRDVPT